MCGKTFINVLAYARTTPQAWQVARRATPFTNLLLKYSFTNLLFKNHFYLHFEMPPIEICHENIKKQHFSINLYRTDFKTYFKTILNCCHFNFNFLLSHIVQKKHEYNICPLGILLGLIFFQIVYESLFRTNTKRIKRTV